MAAKKDSAIARMLRNVTIPVKQNLKLIARERGKIVARREGHNIWVNLGSEFLAQLIAYSDMSPLTPYRDDRTRYMGLGIGGNRQLALPTANGAPYVTAYPGTNAQVDTDPDVVRLERPVRIGGTTSAPPYNVSDEWLAQVQAPPTFPTARSVKFQRLFTETQVSYGTFTTVPLSEVGLFTNAAAVNVFNNTLIAYDTFETLTKTDAIALQVDWTIRFG